MTVVIQGYREISRAFGKLNRQFPKDLRRHLKEAAEPVRADAEVLAGTQIKNMGSGDPWTGMRVGGGTKLVYVAPRQRGKGGRHNPRKRRPNLKDLLLKRAMEKSLENNRGVVVDKAEKALRDAIRDWENLG